MTTGQFSISGGKIVDPEGKAFVARGINVFLDQADAATIMKTFPNINSVRLATKPGASLASIDALVQDLTSHGVVVELEDHSSSGGNPNTLSGQALVDECNWYAQLAKKYLTNPSVWFGTANEPDNTASPQEISAQERAIYDAIRGTGSKAMILLEMRGGFTNDAARQHASLYSSMSGVVWDTHYYGWVPKYSTSMTAIADGLRSQIADAQSVKSADGIMPVIVGEYGPSTTGSGDYDANGLQVVQAVHASGYGTLAWAWNAGTDSLTSKGTSLTDFGQLTADHILAGPLAPPSAVAVPSSSINGPATTSLTRIGSGPDSLVLLISEDAWQGDAQFTVSVDGAQVGNTQTATVPHAAGGIQSYMVNGNFGSGRHAVAINFLNDAWGGTPSTDRNLYMSGASYNGREVSGASLALYSGGVQSFGFLAPSRLTLAVSEDAWQGDAQFTVSVDGVQTGGVNTVTALHYAGATQAFTFDDFWSKGSHSVSVNFLNDAWGGTPSTDRNLYVGAASYDGHANNENLILYSAGAQSFIVS